MLTDLDDMAALYLTLGSACDSDTKIHREGERAEYMYSVLLQGIVFVIDQACYSYATNNNPTCKSGANCGPLRYSTALSNHPPRNE
jgi:aminoglycoside N3'-acetyltransferase